MIKVTVIPSKDPPEVVQKRREEAVRRFFLAIEKDKEIYFYLLGKMWACHDYLEGEDQ